eukprot:m.240778 g.240778  ORF g.240778 m.240778 type:complete len:230 (-) comp16029_c0_seq1:118-807(-)
MSTRGRGVVEVGGVGWQVYDSVLVWVLSLLGDDADVFDVVFWLVNVYAAPIWLVAIFFPKTELARKWFEERVSLLALPFCIVFTVLVLPELEWWLSLFLNGNLSLSFLMSEFTTEKKYFLMLWVYLVGFDVVVFGFIYRKMRSRKCIALEMTLWAVLCALCAPCALGLFTMLQLVSLDDKDDNKDDDNKEKVDEKDEEEQDEDKTKDREGGRDNASDCPVTSTQTNNCK